MKRLLSILLLIVSLSLNAQQEENPLADGLYAKFNLEEDSMIFRLYPDETAVSVISFVGLVEGNFSQHDDGSSYYQNLSFYRVIENYAVFSGDPTNTGEGSPGITFPRENSSLDLADSGILAFLGSPNASQAGSFFITQSGDGYLNKVYTPFGKIVQGEDVLYSIKQDTQLLSIEILRIGPEARDFQASQSNLDAALAAAKQAQLERMLEEEPQLAEMLASLPNYQQTPTGIYYYTQFEGYGDKPKAGDLVTVHYTGSLINGQVFDSSIQRGAPFEVQIGRDAIIPGWIEILMDMRPGESRLTIIPPELGYGERGAGGIIPPNAWLVFEIQILAVE